MNETRLSLIRFVTLRQFDLRGLREVIFAAFICVAITLSVWQRELGVPGMWLIYLALFIVVQEAALQLIDPSRIASFLPAYFAGANCLILTGLQDHLLLARAMTRLRRQGVTSPEKGASA